MSVTYARIIKVGTADMQEYLDTERGIIRVNVSECQENDFGNAAARPRSKSIFHYIAPD